MAAVFFINGGGKQVPKGASEAKPDRSEAVRARKNILEYEGFRARIDMAKPQQRYLSPDYPLVNNSWGVAKW
jgi:hypothetical protein